MPDTMSLMADPRPIPLPDLLRTANRALDVAERVASTPKIEIDVQAALLELEACIGDEYGRVTLGLMQRLREALLAAH